MLVTISGAYKGTWNGAGMLLASFPSILILQGLNVTASQDRLLDAYPKNQGYSWICPCRLGILDL